MQFIQCKNITFSYNDATELLLNNVSFNISDGEKTALLGRNGEGKSTLIKILLGIITDYRGDLFFPRSHPVIGYLPQNNVLHLKGNVLEECLTNFSSILEIYQLKVQLEEELFQSESETTRNKYAQILIDFDNCNGYGLLKEIADCLKYVGLAGMEEHNCLSLSGGEKTRLALAKLLLLKPDLLILDEPTNHLDTDMLDWLENFIHDYPGAVLYVSHDRMFIDRTADRIIHLDKGKITIQKGNYTSYKKNSENQYKHDLIQFHQRDNLIHQLQQAAQKRRAWAGKFQKQTSGEGGGHVYESVFNAARTMMQQAKHIEERINRLEERHNVEKPWHEKTRKISFTDGVKPSENLFIAKDLGKRFADNVVFQNFNLTLNRGDFLHLAGKNGSGKTTLLKIINKQIISDWGEIVYGNRVKIGYLAQEQTNLPHGSTALDYLRQVCSDESKIRTWLGCLGIQAETALQKIATLSEGEKCKLALTRLLLEENNLLLLDEPTNHIDIPSREMLENSLSDFTGSIIFVSHDRRFVEKLATCKFTL